MHVGFITPEYPNERLSKSGGLGTSIKNLAMGLAREGVRVSVFVVNQELEEILFDDTIEIHCLKPKKRLFGQWYFNRKQINEYVEQHVRKSQIDILEAPDWTGITAFMKFSVPLVIRLNGSDGYFCKLDGRKQKFKNYIFERLALKNADEIVSVSTFTGELTNTIFKLGRNITTIHNCINVTDFEPIKTTVKKGQLLYFGTLVRKKGVLELAPIFNEVIEQYEDADFLLIGNDNVDIFEKRSTLDLFMERLNDKAKKKITYKKAVPYHEVRKHISEAHVIVLPSFAEAFPMTWLETLAMEKALVSSDVGWAKELMVDGKTGYTVDPFDHKRYADRIVTLLNNDELCEGMGKKGRQRVLDRFSTEKITKQNMTFYKSLIL